MKDEIIVVVIFAAMCSLFVFNNYAVSHCTVEISDEIEKLKTAIDTENYDEVKHYSKNISDKWDAKMDKILYICHHNQIEDIDRAIFASCQYIEDKQYENAKFRICEAQFLLKDLSEREKLRLDNIF